MAVSVATLRQKGGGVTGEALHLATVQLKLAYALPLNGDVLALLGEPRKAPYKLGRLRRPQLELRASDPEAQPAYLLSGPKPPQAPAPCRLYKTPHGLKP